MNSRRFWVHSVAAAALGLFSLSSHAVLITASANNPYGFSWSYDTVDGLLSGTGTLTVSGFGTTSEPTSSLLVNVTLNNTSSITSNRLTAFGFGITPNAADVDFGDPQGADGGIRDAELSIIPSLASIEICAFGGPRTCQGGGNGGIAGGGSDAFWLLLSGTWGTSVDIAPIGFKYQTGGDSYEFTTTDRPPVTSVPEPGTLGLLAFGAGLIGLGRLRQRRKAS